MELASTMDAADAGRTMPAVNAAVTMAITARATQRRATMAATRGERTRRSTDSSRCSSRRFGKQGIEEAVSVWADLDAVKTRGILRQGQQVTR
jgi:hypothetical protein